MRKWLGRRGQCGLSVLQRELETPKSEEELQATATNFVDKWQFPHCLGALDGKHIYIQPTGRVSDSGLFAHSDLKKALDRGLLNVPPPEKLPGSEIVLPYMFVGDEAYPLRTDLMKPYPFRQLDHSQRVYNYRLSRARRVVENAFGILASRFRMFRSTILLHPDSVTKITLASVCLHNFLCDRRSEAYMTPALADWEDVDHVESMREHGGEMVWGPCNVCQLKGHETLPLLLSSNVTS
ncbi:hypothetical protein QQF64_007882 [Cirrhinus molitorella]|uniref:DDE Tnp4 domain-containing protein n=1 Tax=Cirrhinus molitorella TaxID=172907 RepID=A0ABR3M5G2_9TELE